LIISGGSNDLDDPNSSINKIIVPLTEFIKQHEHTNVIVVNIPHRYDFENNSCLNSINRKINRCNTKLTKLLKIYPHVSLIDTTTDRTHFTKHGFHLNNPGKEWAVTQNYKLIGSNVLIHNKSESPLPLQWINIQIEEVSNAGENIPTDNLELSCRTSSRNKKTLITITGDFLWESIF
jgi:hypothetical protein